MADSNKFTRQDVPDVECVLQYLEQEYWERVTAIANGPMVCEGCGKGRVLALEGRKKREFVVRLALKNPKRPANDWRNVAPFCTKCRKDGIEPKYSKRVADKLTIPMFTEAT